MTLARGRSLLILGDAEKTATLFVVRTAHNQADPPSIFPYVEAISSKTKGKGDGENLERKAVSAVERRRRYDDASWRRATALRRGHDGVAMVCRHR